MIIRAIEFAFLFVGLPTAYWLRWIALPMIPFLILVTLVCVAILLRDKTFDRASLWNAGAVRAGLPRVIALFCVAACGIGALVAVLAPDTLFALVKRSPLLWAMIMVLYPLFSVYPQELVYRAFFAHRYSALFSNTMVRILASSLAFGYMHIVFRNEIAVVMTLIGGAIFAYTYERSKSALLVSIEHALYGCFIFTIGLGAYFYGGAVR